MEEIVIKLTIYIRANSAESGPPLGTILGNIGVNTVKFCKEFNEHTKDLPNYFILRVCIIISENKSFTFTIELPSIGFLIYLLKKEETLKNKDGVVTVTNYIYLEDLLKLSKFKFPNYDIKKSSKILKGSLLSANINVRL
jgi:large subunit ribosomal protein L11